MEVAFAASDGVRASLAQIGRTEDVVISPDGTRFAVAGFARHCILIVGIEVDPGTVPARVTLSNAWEVESASFCNPHGVFWIDERTLIVANRDGLLAIVELPDHAPPSSRIRLDPVRILGKDRGDFVMTPGSVSTLAVANGVLEVLVCNNYVHHVSRHLLDRGAGYACLSHAILLSEDLAVPDGVAHSPSGRWLAISNHHKQLVYLYRNDGRLNCTSKPDGILRGVTYPHGLRFSADERSILVADAGAPYVRIFCADECETGADWAGERVVAENVQVLSQDVFDRGNFHIGEGGPKGIDITRDGRLMIVTCQEQPLAMFDLGNVTAMKRGPCPLPETASTREVLLRYFTPPEQGSLAGRLRKRARLRRQKMRILVKRCHARLRWGYARMKVPLKRVRDEYRKARGVGG